MMDDYGRDDLPPLDDYGYDDLPPLEDMPDFTAQNDSALTVGQRCE